MHFPITTCILSGFLIPGGDALAQVGSTPGDSLVPVAGLVGQAAPALDEVVPPVNVSSIDVPPREVSALAAESGRAVGSNLGVAVTASGDAPPLSRRSDACNPLRAVPPELLPPMNVTANDAPMQLQVRRELACCARLRLAISLGPPGMPRLRPVRR